jgi:hypothetical protein
MRLFPIPEFSFWTKQLVLWTPSWRGSCKTLWIKLLLVCLLLKLFQSDIHSWHQAHTTITIAHRLSTIKDADVISLMGDGCVIEQGTHNNLLRDENETYSRLVQAQKLREQREVTNDSESDTAASERDMEKAAREEPLGRKNTGRSLASEIIEQKRKAHGDGKEGGDLGLPYLFMRMGKLNREGWWSYFFGLIFAIGTNFFLV